MFQESEALRAVDLLLDTYRKPAIMLYRPYPPINLPKTRSRLGGLPQLPDTFQWPRGSENGVEVPLHFLAQIDCAELPRIDRRMPTAGMLFFFGRDDEEQIWGDTKPQDDVRVIYAPVVAGDQPERPAPPDLLPIGGTYSRSPWLLPKEAGPSIHASWPVVPLRIDSWPDLSAIYDLESYRTVVTSGIDLFENFNALYERRLNARRVAAVVAATGLPTRGDVKPTKWGEDILMFGSTSESRFHLPSDPSRESKVFPQVGIMIDRIARLIVKKASSYLMHRSYQDDLVRKEKFVRIEADGRNWIERARQIGEEGIPPETDIRDFTAWLTSLASVPVPAPKRSGFSKLVHDCIAGVTGSARPVMSSFRRSIFKGDLPDIFHKGLQSCITSAATSPGIAARIPPYFYNALENSFLPYNQDKYAQYEECEDWRLKAAIHHMLGYDESCQEAETLNEQNVLLLQLYSDQVLYMGFGDVGKVSFWIKAGDLEALNFVNVRGEIVGH